jgi:multidrug efflux pump subunit AcrB
VLAIAEDIEPRLTALCNKHNLSFKFLGYVAEAEQARKRTRLGAVALLCALYAMLAVALKSLVQPLYVMLAIPFAIIGALLGHIVMDLTPSYLSIFGMMALAGVAVNDTLVMVDYINRRVGQGVTLQEATLEAGGRRFRPIMLTSITTFAGLMPLMLDRSLQAQFLIPMAVSLAFGVLFATIVTLYLIPCVLLTGEEVRKAFVGFCHWYSRPFSAADSVPERPEETHVS